MIGAKTVRWVLMAVTAAMLGVCGYGDDTFEITTKAQARETAFKIIAPTSFQIPPNKNVPLPVKISPDSSLPKQAIVLIRGLPSSIALTVGRSFESGVWGVKPSELPKLSVNSLGGTGLTSKLSVSVVTLDGTILAESSINLVVVPQWDQDTTQSIASNQKQVKTAFTDTGKKSLQISQQDKARIATLLQKGNEYFKIGSVIIARGFYTKAAELGSNEAMVALARTFDPAELSQASLPITVKPDAARARKWYEKAKRHGSVKAAQYLERLSR
jgi:TPR repeat protein